MVSFFLVLPSPHELVHGLQSIPFLVILAILNIPLKGLDDGMSQLQIGLKFQGFRLQLFPSIEQYLKEISQSGPDGLDGLDLSNDYPLLQLLVIGDADGQGSYHMLDADQQLLGLALVSLLHFIGHSLLPQHLPEVGRVYGSVFFELRDRCP